jgi:hypothetical protein
LIKLVDLRLQWKVTSLYHENGTNSRTPAGNSSSGESQSRGNENPSREDRGHEELMAIMKADDEVIEAEMKACLEVMVAMIRASQKYMGAKVKSGLEEMKASELEANQERIRGHGRALRRVTTCRSHTGTGF